MVNVWQVWVVSAVLQVILFMRPVYDVMQDDIKKLTGLSDGIVAFQLSVADLWPLLLGSLAVLITRDRCLISSVIGINFSFVVPVGHFLFFAGVVYRSIKLLFIGRLLESLGMVFAHNVALLPLWRRGLSSNNATILYAFNVAITCFSRAAGYWLYKRLHVDLGY